MRVVSTIKSYNNIQILRHTLCLPSYRHTAFPTQIFRKLLNMLIQMEASHSFNHILQACGKIGIHFS
jgi:hypothetical protein